MPIVMQLEILYNKLVPIATIKTTLVALTKLLQATENDPTLPYERCALAEITHVGAIITVMPRSAS